MRKKTLALAVAAVAVLAGCSSEADVSIENNVKAAENFEVMRRIVFINGITDTYLLEIEGRCSWETPNGVIEVVCKLGEDADGRAEIVRHSMLISDNVTFVSEQLEPGSVDTFHYRLNFRPEVILPYIDLETSIDIEGDG